MNDPLSKQPELQKTPQVDQIGLENYLRRLRNEQNLPLGIVGGLVAMLIGAGIWAGIAVMTDYRIGWIAIGVGFIVGMGVRLLGKGLDTSFGLVGGFLAGLGCLLGNFFIILTAISREFNVSILQVLISFDLATDIELMIETFEIIDLLFYGLAIYAGYRYAFRRVSQEELAKFVQ
jgi:hypothetical protein